MPNSHDGDEDPPKGEGEGEGEGEDEYESEIPRWDIFVKKDGTSPEKSWNTDKYS